MIVGRLTECHCTLLEHSTVIQSQFYHEHVKPRPKKSMAWVVPESVQVVLSIGVVLIILTLMWMIFAKLMGITSDQGRYRFYFIFYL